MSYEAKALQVLTQAESQRDPFPWPLVIVLTRAVVVALLAIAAAVEACNNE